MIVHRNKELRKHQTFTTDNWLGGLYASSGVLGTKAAGRSPPRGRSMHYLGEEGYVDRSTKSFRAASAWSRGCGPSRGSACSASRR